MDQLYTGFALWVMTVHYPVNMIPSKNLDIIKKVHYLRNRHQVATQQLKKLIYALLLVFTPA